MYQDDKLKIIKLVILVYHKIGQPSEYSKFPSLYVSEENFIRHIKYLKVKGYTFVTLSELKLLHDYYYFQKNNKINSYLNKTQKYVAITFDDGIRTIYNKAFEILKNNNLKSSIFLVSGLIGKFNEWDIKKGENPEEILHVDEIKEMMNYGIEIGSHSKTHPDLTKIPLKEAYDEIFNSKIELEDLLGIRINFFAYPFGGYNENIKQLVEKAGYIGACIAKAGRVKHNADFFALNRVTITNNTSFFKFKSFFNLISLNIY